MSKLQQNVTLRKKISRRNTTVFDIISGILFGDKSNCIHKTGAINQHDRQKVRNTWSINKYTKGDSTPSTKGFHSNCEWDVSVNRSIISDTLSPSPIVRIQNISADELEKYNNINSLTVRLKPLSIEDLSKHLKECRVIVSDVLHTLHDGLGDVSANLNDAGMTLRKRGNKIDYREFDKENHVPIYQQKRREKIKKQDDIYEFHSEREGKTKKRRRISSDESSPFEKEMKLQMCQIEKKEKARLKKKGRKINVNTLNRNPTIKVKGNLRNLGLNRIGTNSKQYKKAETELRNNPQIEILNDNHSICIDDDGLNQSDVDAPPTEITDPKPTNTNLEHKVPDFALNILQDIDLLQFMASDMKEKCQTVQSPLNNASVTQPKILNGSPSKCTSVSLDDDIDSFDSSTLEQPMGTSTPWRPNFQIKRNPFFLQVKETSLPSYNQDMVIDSNTIKLLSSDCGTMQGLSTRNNTKRRKQTSLHSHINGTNVSDSPDVIESSLYDIHQLSPIKQSKSRRKSSFNKENQFLNSPSLFLENDISRAKRRILGDKVDNSVNIANSTMRTFRTNQISTSQKEMSYFGFNNSINNSGTDKELSKSKKPVWLFGKPMRLDDYMVTKTSNNGATNRNSKKELTAVVERKNVVRNKEQETQQIDEDNVPQLSANMRLFEDLEPINKTDEPKTYERVPKKRHRRKSYNAEDDNDEKTHPHPRKRKKDKRKMAEEKQVDEWARGFNEMCKEVEEFLLEID